MADLENQVKLLKKQLVKKGSTTYRYGRKGGDKSGLNKGHLPKRINEEELKSSKPEGKSC